MIDRNGRVHDPLGRFVRVAGAIAAARWAADGSYRPSRTVADFVDRIRHPKVRDFGREDALYADALNAVVEETRWDIPAANLWLLRETGAF